MPAVNTITHEHKFASNSRRHRLSKTLTMDRQATVFFPLNEIHQGTQIHSQSFREIQFEPHCRMTFRIWTSILK